MPVASARVSSAAPGSGCAPETSTAAWAMVALGLLTVAVWGWGLAGDFQYDDTLNVVRDEATSEWAAFTRRLAGNSVRPLLRASYYADHLVWGMRPAGFLATNLFLHLFTVLGVYRLARGRLAARGAGAFLAAAVFAVQPAHAEVVCYVSGRSCGLSAALIVGGLLLVERAGSLGGRGRRAALALALTAFASACLARETALVFPLLLLVWRSTRPDAEPPEAAPAAALSRGFLAAAVAVAAVVLLVLVATPRYRYLASVSLGLAPPGRALVANLQALPQLLSLWLRPWALSLEHGFDPGSSGLAIAAGCAATVLTVVGAWALRRRWPMAAFAVLWTAVVLAPTSSVFARLDPITERPLYLAWIGPALLAGMLGGKLLDRIAAARAPRGVRIAVTAALAAMVTIGAVWSLERVHTWSDARRLWADATTKAPQSSRAWDNLGVAFMAESQDELAAMAFRRALSLNPSNGAARRNLAILRTLCRACDVRRGAPRETLAE